MEYTTLRPYGQIEMISLSGNNIISLLDMKAKRRVTRIETVTPVQPCQNISERGKKKDDRGDF